MLPKRMNELPHGLLPENVWQSRRKKKLVSSLWSSRRRTWSCFIATIPVLMSA